jgi:hypothetical protein
MALRRASARSRSHLLAGVTLAGCTPFVAGDPFPAPDAWRAAGPGVGPRTYAEADLFTDCAALPGGPEDVDHHNHVVLVDGYVLVPWAPEYAGAGGISFFDLSDPCAPVKVGEASSDVMRETHILGIHTGADGRRFVAVDYLEPPTPDAASTTGGVGVFDITDPTEPTWLSALALPNHVYPDSYTRVALATAWVGDTIYVANATNGVYIVDASDPEALTLYGQTRFEGPHVVGGFRPWGTVGMASSMGVSRTVLLDLSDPWSPVALPGGDWSTEDADGTTRPYYAANVGGTYAWFARSKDGGGPLVYDISDPTAPQRVGDVKTPDGDGGYVFLQNDHLFVGDSNFGSVYDATDPAAMRELGRFALPGDLDTVTPLGNVAVVAVDEKADPGRASVVVPWQAEPETVAPRPGLLSPADGEVGVASTARIGVVYDEMIEPASVHRGSFRVADAAGRPIPGTFDVLESIINFTPNDPLPAGPIHVVLPAGGITDASGNRQAVDRAWWFVVGGGG